MKLPDFGEPKSLNQRVVGSSPTAPTKSKQITAKKRGAQSSPNNPSKMPARAMPMIVRLNGVNWWFNVKMVNF